MDIGFVISSPKISSHVQLFAIDSSFVNKLFRESQKSICCMYQGYFCGGGPRDLGRCISKFLEVGRCIFPQKRVFFRNFRDVSTNNTPKITFYCIFIYKFPKNFEKVLKNFQISKKVLKNFSRRLRRRENPFFPSFFSPPPLEGWPPKYPWYVPEFERISPSSMTNFSKPHTYFLLWSFPRHFWATRPRKSYNLTIIHYHLLRPIIDYEHRNKKMRLKGLDTICGSIFFKCT